MDVARHTAAALSVMLLLAGCTSGDDDAGAGSPDDVELVTFDDGYLRFDHPADWDIVEQDDGAERRLRIERPGDADAGHPDAMIFAVWPVIPGDDLDRTVDFFAPDPESAAVTDLDDQDLEVAGASDAVLHRFVATDAVPGEDLAVRFWGIYAMADAGRTVHLLIGIPEGSEYDDDVADLVIDSLVLQDAP